MDCSLPGFSVQLTLKVLSNSTFWRFWVLLCCVACMLSCVWLFAIPRTVAHQVPLSWEFSRQDYWSGLPFPPAGDLPYPGIELVFPVAPALAGRLGSPLCCVDQAMSTTHFRVHHSVAQSHPTICDHMDCSTSDFPVLHHLQQLAQIHVQWVSDAIQASHPLPSPSPSAFNLSQHQELKESCYMTTITNHPLWNSSWVRHTKGKKHTLKRSLEKSKLQNYFKYLPPIPLYRSLVVFPLFLIFFWKNHWVKNSSSFDTKSIFRKTKKIIQHFKYFSVAKEKITVFTCFKCTLFTFHVSHSGWVL